MTSSIQHCQGFADLPRSFPRDIHCPQSATESQYLHVRNHDLLSMFGVSTYDSRRRYPGDERQWKKHLQRRLLDGGHDENQLRTCATALAGVVLVVFVIGVVYYSSVQRAGDAPEPIAQVNDMAVAIPRADPPAISNDKVGSSIIARFRSTVPHRNLTLMVQDAEIAGGAVATDTGLAPIPDESAEQEQPMESGDLTSISPDNVGSKQLSHVSTPAYG